MLEILFYSIWGCNIICCLKRVNSKIINIITFLLIIILFAGNTYNNDFYAYANAYEYNYRIDEFEIGFRSLMIIFKSIGLTYNQFLLIIAIVGYGLIYKTVFKYTKNISTFIALYFAILFFYDINQIRNFLACSLLFYAITKLIEKKYALYIGIVVLASTIHSMFIIYVILVFIDWFLKKNKMNYRVYVTSILAFCILIFVNGNRIPGLNYVVKNIIGQESSKWYYFSGQVHLGFLVSYILQFANMYLVSVSRKNVLKNYGIDNKYSRIMDICYWCCIFGFVSFPLLMIDHNFYRIFRNLNYLVYLATSISIFSFRVQGKGKYTKKNISNYVFLIIYSIVWFICMIYKYRTVSQIDLILHNNMFL